jgi:hypothetical protein
MRIFGLVMFLTGSAGTAWTMRESFARTRGKAALFGLLAPIAVLIALTGALLIFVPGFFGGSGS